MPIIEVQQVQKIFQASIRRKGRFSTLRSLFRPEFREIMAVKDISFAIEQGESVAYLGPNGAGKSTTIKMLTGILEPSGGRISVGGLIPQKNRIKNSYQIGAVFGNRSQLFRDLPVKDSFEMLRYMYSIDNNVYERNVKEFASVMDVEGLLDRPVRTLSLGQRMRCEMIAALLHDPEILFLDEPTIGLDVVAKERIRAFIDQMNREKKVTILLTTHDLHDIEMLCKRLIIIDKGQKIYDGSLDYIKKHFATERKVRVEMPSQEAAASLADQMAQRRDVAVSLEELVVVITYDQNQMDTALLLRDILDIGQPRDLVMKDEDIESLIRRIYQHGLEGTRSIQESAASGGL